MHILVTGLSGMVGATVADHLRESYSFEDISTESGVDIRHADRVHDRIKKSKASIVIHLAAKADVDGCEGDYVEDMRRLQDTQILIPDRTGKHHHINTEAIQSDEWADISSAFSINTVGTLNIVRACQDLNKKLIYVSTDFVFDGTSSSPYVEEDMPNPLNHYAMTKYWGEVIVATMLKDYVIARTSFPYGTRHETRKDFVRIIRDRFEKNQPISGVTDQIFTPTYAGDIAAAFDHMINHSISGNIFHVVGSESLSPHDAVVAIAEEFDYDTNIINGVSAKEFYAHRAQRPRNLTINNDKIVKRGVPMKTFRAGLQSINSL